MTGSYIHHLKIAQGSLKELETHLILSVRVHLTTPEAVAEAMGMIDETGKMLRA